MHENDEKAQATSAWRKDFEIHWGRHAVNAIRCCMSMRPEETNYTCLRKARKGYNHETKMSGPVEIAEVSLYDDGRGDP